MKANSATRSAGGAVDGVGGHLGEAQLTGHSHRFEAKGVAGEGTGAVRAGVDALIPIGETFHVTQQRPHVGHELVGKQNWLGVLHMRTSRHDGATGFFGLLDQCCGETEQHFGDDAAVAAQPHADERGDLIVAGTAGAELAAEFVTCDLKQAAFECSGLVLVILDRSECSGIHAALQLVKGVFHALQLIGGQQSGAAQCTGMGARTGDIVIGESPVELGGLAQPCEFRRRTRLETAAPQGKMLTISSALGHCFSKSPCRYD